MTAVALVLAVAACAATARAARTGGDRELWLRLARGTAAATAGTALSVLLVSSGAPVLVVDAVLAAASVVVFTQVYGALVRWNRYPTALADPHDVLNGVSGVLTGVSLLDTALRLLWPTAATASWWQLSSRELPVVVLVVCLGTALSLASIAGLARDHRLWWNVAAMASALAAATGWLAGLGPSSGAAPWWATWCGAAAAGWLVLASRTRGGSVRPALAVDPAASTRGAFSVVVMAVAALLVAHALDSGPVAVTTAALAVLGAALRLRNNLTDLAHLGLARRLAHTDDLTGLANRRALLAELTARHAAGRPLVLALLDLDRFKEVNDGLGHAAGDALIAAVAERLEDRLPHGHLLARLGGDEFAVVVDADQLVPLRDQSEDLGRAVSTAMADPFRVGAVVLHVSASAGLATSSGADDHWREPAHGAAELLRHADAAMYQAKRSGSSVALYDEAVHARSAGEVLLAEQLRSALRGGGQLVLHHQPQLSASTGRVVGVEALVRWQHPERGLLAPGSFLPSAEAHGLMGELSEVVLELAVAQLAQWGAHDLALRMSVNLSASNLLDTFLPQRVAALLHDLGVAPGSLVLEVTETVLISDLERSLAVLEELAALGVGLSIDDYGTGYSSLTYLTRLPVHELKLDRSFTLDLHSSERARAVVASTVDLAHALGLRVIAEGVEDEQTLHQLIELGCDETQGYLHSPALPAVELVDWVRQHGPTAACAEPVTRRA